MPFSNPIACGPMLRRRAPSVCAESVPGIPDQSNHSMGDKESTPTPNRCQKVVPGSVRRDPAARTIDFRVSDGTREYPVTYKGLVPDTFTDANDIDVVVEGRLGKDGVFHATDWLAKCGSRYNAVPTSWRLNMFGPF